jgi:phage terminase large subunit-like protein
MDLEESMEAYIKVLSRNFDIAEVRYDPFQFHRSATTLTKEGINMVEFPQTVGNLTDMGQCLFDVVKHQSLKLYADADMRKEASFAVGKETPRGMRIVKEKASHKIDAIVALAMATHAASTAPESEQPWELPYEVDPNPGWRVNEFGERVSPGLQNLGSKREPFYVERRIKEPWERDF